MTQMRGPTTPEIEMVPTVVGQHPALVKEESYLISSASQGAVVVVNLQGKTDEGEWNDKTTTLSTRIQDFYSEGVEGEDDYKPKRSIVTTNEGTVTLDNEQIAQDINDMRLSAHVQDSPVAQKYGAAGLPFVVMGIAVNAYIGAKLQEQAAQNQ